MFFSKQELNTIGEMALLNNSDKRYYLEILDNCLQPYQETDCQEYIYGFTQCQSGGAKRTAANDFHRFIQKIANADGPDYVFRENRRNRRARKFREDRIARSIERDSAYQISKQFEGYLSNKNLSVREQGTTPAPYSYVTYEVNGQYVYEISITGRYEDEILVTLRDLTSVYYELPAGTGFDYHIDTMFDADYMYKGNSLHQLRKDFDSILLLKR